MTGTHSDPDFQAGFLSYKNNDGAYSNPHRKGADEYNKFERGWTQAHKRSHEIPVRRYRRMEQKLEYEIYKQEVENKKNDLELAVAKKQYLKSKGE